MSQILDNDDAEISKQSTNKPGMIYISRIPPGMTPSKVRAIMAQHGELGRIYLAPTGVYKNHTITIPLINPFSLIKSKESTLQRRLDRVQEAQSSEESRRAA